MKALIARIDAWARSECNWTYRPESMKPRMRKRPFVGFNQCQIYKDGKWVKAPYPATRYQWAPRKVVAAVAIAGIGVESNESTIHMATAA